VNADTVDGGKAAFDMDDAIPSTWVWRLGPGTRLADPCECRNHEDEATFHADEAQDHEDTATLHEGEQLSMRVSNPSLRIRLPLIDLYQP